MDRITQYGRRAAAHPALRAGGGIGDPIGEMPAIAGSGHGHGHGHGSGVADLIEEHLLLDGTSSPPPPGGPTISQKVEGYKRAISAIAGKARRRGGDPASPSSLEQHPDHPPNSPGSGTAGWTAATSKPSSSKGSSRSSLPHNPSRSQQPAAMDAIATAPELKPSRSSGGGSQALSSFPATSSAALESSLGSAGSTASFLARPAVQALAALLERSSEDGDDDFEDGGAGWSGSSSVLYSPGADPFRVGSSSTGIGSARNGDDGDDACAKRSRDRERADLQVLAGHALGPSSRAAVMAETDVLWDWASTMAECRSLLLQRRSSTASLPPQTTVGGAISKRPAGGMVL